MQPRWHGENRPVVGVSWYEAMAYARWRGLRLPNEDEWIFAFQGCREQMLPLMHQVRSSNENFLESLRARWRSYEGRTQSELVAKLVYGSIIVLALEVLACLQHDDPHVRGKLTA